MKPEQMRELLTFNTWADRRMMETVSALTPEEFTQDLHSSFPTVRDTLVHIAGVEWVWLERAQGRSPERIPDTQSIPDIGTLRTYWDDVGNEWHEYAKKLTQEHLDEFVAYKTFSFGPGRDARWQMLQHMVNHGTYHRGQVSTMLRQLGAKSVGTDLIIFYRERAAAAGA
jgi:uncharacterized damage-inducible protein DinB